MKTHNYGNGMDGRLRSISLLPDAPWQALVMLLAGVAGFLVNAALALMLARRWQAHGSGPTLAIAVSCAVLAICFSTASILVWKVYLVQTP